MAEEIGVVEAATISCLSEELGRKTRPRNVAKRTAPTKVKWKTKISKTELASSQLNHDTATTYVDMHADAYCVVSSPSGQSRSYLVDTPARSLVAFNCEVDQINLAQQNPCVTSEAVVKKNLAALGQTRSFGDLGKCDKSSNINQPESLALFRGECGAAGCFASDANGQSFYDSKNTTQSLSSVFRFHERQHQQETCSRDQCSLGDRVAANETENGKNNGKRSLEKVIASIKLKSCKEKEQCNVSRHETAGGETENYLRNAEERNTVNSVCSNELIDESFDNEVVPQIVCVQSLAFKASQTAAENPFTTSINSACNKMPTSSVQKNGHNIVAHSAINIVSSACSSGVPASHTTKEGKRTNTGSGQGHDNSSWPSNLTNIAPKSHEPSGTCELQQSLEKLHAYADHEHYANRSSTNNQAGTDKFDTKEHVIIGDTHNVTSSSELSHINSNHSTLVTETSTITKPHILLTPQATHGQQNNVIVASKTTPQNANAYIVLDSASIPKILPKNTDEHFGNTSVESCESQNSRTTINARLVLPKNPYVANNIKSSAEPCLEASNLESGLIVAQPIKINIHEKRTKYQVRKKNRSKKLPVSSESRKCTLTKKNSSTASNLTSCDKTLKHKLFVCEYQGCKKTFVKNNDYLQHLSQFPDHRMKVLKFHDYSSAFDVCSSFLPEQINPYYRKARVRELFKHLTDEELKEFALPRLARNTHGSLLWDFLEKQAEHSRVPGSLMAKIFVEFEQFRTEVEQNLRKNLFSNEKNAYCSLAKVANSYCGFSQTTGPVITEQNVTSVVTTHLSDVIGQSSTFSHVLPQEKTVMPRSLSITSLEVNNQGLNIESKNQELPVDRGPPHCNQKSLNAAEQQKPCSAIDKSCKTLPVTYPWILPKPPRYLDSTEYTKAPSAPLPFEIVNGRLVEKYIKKPKVEVNDNEFLEFVKTKPHHCARLLNSAEDLSKKKFLPTHLFPRFFEMHNDALVEMAAFMLTELQLSHVKYCSVLRKEVGTKLQAILGYNIFPPVGKVSSQNRTTIQEAPVRDQKKSCKRKSKTAKKPTKHQRVENCDSKGEVIAFADAAEERRTNEKDGNVEKRKKNKFPSTKLNASNSKDMDYSKENQTKELYKRVHETRKVTIKLNKSDSQEGPTSCGTTYPRSFTARHTDFSESDERNSPKRSRQVRNSVLDITDKPLTERQVVTMLQTTPGPSKSSLTDFAKESVPTKAGEKLHPATKNGNLFKPDSSDNSIGEDHAQGGCSFPADKAWAKNSEPCSTSAIIPSVFCENFSENLVTVNTQAAINSFRTSVTKGPKQRLTKANQTENTVPSPSVLNSQIYNTMTFASVATQAASGQRARSPVISLATRTDQVNNETCGSESSRTVKRAKHVKSSKFNHRAKAIEHKTKGTTSGTAVQALEATGKNVGSKTFAHASVQVATGGKEFPHSRRKNGTEVVHNSLKRVATTDASIQAITTPIEDQVATPRSSICSLAHTMSKLHGDISTSDVKDKTTCPVSEGSKFEDRFECGLIATPVSMQVTVSESSVKTSHPPFVNSTKIAVIDPPFQEVHSQECFQPPVVKNLSVTSDKQQLSLGLTTESFDATPMQTFESKPEQAVVTVPIAEVSYTTLMQKPISTTRVTFGSKLEALKSSTMQSAVYHKQTTKRTEVSSISQDDHTSLINTPADDSGTTKENNTEDSIDYENTSKESTFLQPHAAHLQNNLTKAKEPPAQVTLLQNSSSDNLPLQGLSIKPSSQDISTETLYKETSVETPFQTIKVETSPKHNSTETAVNLPMVISEQQFRQGSLTSPQDTITQISSSAHTLLDGTIHTEKLCIVQELQLTTGDSSLVSENSKVESNKNNEVKANTSLEHALDKGPGAQTLHVIDEETLPGFSVENIFADITSVPSLNYNSPNSIQVESTTKERAEKGACGSGDNIEKRSETVDENILFNSSANMTENSTSNGPGIAALKTFLAFKRNCAQSDTPTCNETLPKGDVIDALKDFLSRKLHENESEGPVNVAQSSLEEIKSPSRAQALRALKVFLTSDASESSTKLSEGEQNGGTEIDDSKTPVIEALRELLANRSKQEEEQTTSDNEQKSHDTLKTNVLKVLRDFLANRSSNIIDEEKEPNVNISHQKRQVIETLSEFLSAKTSFKQTGAKVHEGEEMNKEILSTNVSSGRFVGKMQKELGKSLRKISARSKQRESINDHGSEEESFDVMLEKTDIQKIVRGHVTRDSPVKTENCESGPAEFRQRDTLFSADVKMKPASQSNLLASVRRIQASPANEDVVKSLEEKSNTSKGDGECVKIFGTEDRDVGTDAERRRDIAGDSPICKNAAAVFSKYFGKEMFVSTESDVTAAGSYQARKCFLTTDDIEGSQQEIMGATYLTCSDKKLFTTEGVHAVSSENMAGRFPVPADSQKVSSEETTGGLSGSRDDLEMSSNDTAKLMSISADGQKVPSEDTARGLTVSIDHDQKMLHDYPADSLLTSADGKKVSSDDSSKLLSISVDGQGVSLDDTVRGLSFFENDKEMLSDDTAKVLPVSAAGQKEHSDDMMGGFPVSANDHEASSESTVGETPISLMAGEMLFSGEKVQRDFKEKVIERWEPTVHRQQKFNRKMRTARIRPSGFVSRPRRFSQRTAQISFVSDDVIPEISVRQAKQPSPKRTVTKP